MATKNCFGGSVFLFGLDCVLGVLLSLKSYKNTVFLGFIRTIKGSNSFFRCVHLVTAFKNFSNTSAAATVTERLVWLDSFVSDLIIFTRKRLELTVCELFAETVFQEHSALKLKEHFSNFIVIMALVI